MSISGFLGYSTYQRSGLGWRNAANNTEKYEGDIGHNHFHSFIYKKYFPCFQSAIFKAAPVWEGYTRCQQSHSSIKVDIALIGDSKAEELFIGLANAIPDKNIAFYTQNAPPLIGDGNFTKIFKEILSDRNIKQVVLAADWYRRQDQILTNSSWSTELSKTDKAIEAHDKEVYISDGIPIYPYDPYKCKFQRKFSSSSSRCTISTSDFYKIYSSYASDLMKVAQDNGIILLNIAQFLCTSTDGCSMVLGNKILYRDAYHLNINGSLYIGSSLIKNYPNLNSH